MPKPGRRIKTPSEEIAHFTDREGQQEVFRRHLFSKEEPPVLVFYGVGGAGKSWLLKKLCDQVPADTPYAFLDFDSKKGGMRFVFDPAAGLYDIRDQFGMPSPRFDLAYSVLRMKQGETEKSSALNDLAAEVVGASFPMPGAGLFYKHLSQPLLERLKGTPIEDFLINYRTTVCSGAAHEIKPGDRRRTALLSRGRSPVLSSRTCRSYCVVCDFLRHL